MPVQRTPDLLFWKLRRARLTGRTTRGGFFLLPDQPFSNFRRSNFARVASVTRRGISRAVSVVIGRQAEVPEAGLQKADGVTTIFFDTEKWQVNTQE